MRSTFVLVAAALATSLAFAQSSPSVADLKNVQGNVLIGDASGISSATNGQKIPGNVSVTTTADASVDVVFNNGCTVSLKPSQRLDVNAGSSCEALIASVAPVAAPTAALGAPVAASAGAAGVSGTTLAVLGGVGLAGALYANCHRRASPSSICR